MLCSLDTTELLYICVQLMAAQYTGILYKILMKNDPTDHQKKISNF